MANPNSARSPWVLVPPPPLYVASFVAGAQLGNVLGLALPAMVEPVARVLGACVILAGVLVMLPAPLLFLWTHTTIVPHGRARALITSGPYRVTRNPMYVGLTAVHVGLALALNQVVALALLPLPLLVLSAKTIPYEERILEDAFGDEYRAYKRRVRRWI